MTDEKQKPEYELQYTQFTPRSYGVAVHGARNGKRRTNKPLIDPASFFFARWFLNSPNRKKVMIENWLAEVSKSVDERGYEPIFNFDDAILADIGDVYKHGERKGKSKRSRKLLAELTSEQLADNSRQRLFSLNRSYNMFDLSLDEIFFLNDADLRQRWPVVQDGIHIGACLKRKSGGSRVREYDRVSVAGPFEDSSIPLARIGCDCEDSMFTERKQGYSPLEYVCTATASMLYLGWRDPSKVRGLRELQKQRKRAKIWLPFNPQEIQTVPKSLYTVKQDSVQPPLDVLVVDSRFDAEFNRASRFEVSKKLARAAVSYHRMLWEMIYDGIAGFEVIANEYVVGRSKPMAEPVKKWFNSYKRNLQRHGFEEQGLVLEKKDSPYETVAMRFVKEDEERRILFSRDHPPVVAVRKPRRGQEVDVFYEEKRKNQYAHKHPFEELFQPKPMFDDNSREVENYEVIIPTEVYIPDEMIRDYHKAVEAFFPGGAKKLIPKVKARGGDPYMSRIKTIVAQGRK